MKSLGFARRVGLKIAKQFRPNAPTACFWAGAIAVIALFVLGIVHEGKASELSLIGDYPVTVDCTKSLTEMYNTDLYGYTDPDIATGTPPVVCSGRVNVTITILLLDKIFRSPMEVSMLLNKKGCRSATLPELIALDNAHHEALVLYKGGPVILAYGTMWRYVSKHPFGNPEAPIFSFAKISVLRFTEEGRNLGGAFAYPDPPWKISKAHLAAVCSTA